MADKKIIQNPEKYKANGLEMPSSHESKPETSQEQGVEKSAEQTEVIFPEINSGGTTGAASDPQDANSLKFQKAIKTIEDVFSKDENFQHIVKAMQRDKAAVFIKKGEQMSLSIYRILEKIGNLAVPKEDIKKIMSLIVDWLKVVPSISRFYINQEAKIKTEQILDELNFRRAGD
jgi:hypothetical protein